MYQIIQKDCFIKSFNTFWEAWLYVKLEAACYCLIIGPDGQWKINPTGAN